MKKKTTTAAEAATYAIEAIQDMRESGASVPSIIMNAQTMLVRSADEESARWASEAIQEVRSAGHNLPHGILNAQTMLDRVGA